MASILDLPNELIVAIASNLHRPYDTLQLILARDMYSHGAITPLPRLLKQPGVHLGSGVHVLDLKLELNAKYPDFGPPRSSPSSS